MATKKLHPGGTIGPAPVADPELLAAADELESKASTIAARASLLRTPGLAKEHVAPILRLRDQLRAVFAPYPWAEVIRDLAKAEGVDIRLGRKFGLEPGLDLTARAKRILRTAGAPRSVKVAAVENLIRANIETTGGRGKHDGAGSVADAFEKLTGKKPDSVRKSKKRRTR